MQLSYIDINNKVFQKDYIPINDQQNILVVLSQNLNQKSNCSVYTVRETKEMSTEVNIDPHFKEIHKRKNKWIFYENREDEANELLEEKNF